jgi:hypothetical protein
MVPGLQQDARLGAELRAESPVVTEIKIPKSGGIAACLDDLVIGLRRHNHGHAEDQRDQQAHRPRAEQRGKRVFAHHEPCRHPRHQEQQRQPPGIEHQHQGFQRRNAMRTFDVKPPGHVEHADMVEDQQAEGGDPHPVEVDPPLRAGADGICRL